LKKQKRFIKKHIVQARRLELYAAFSMYRILLVGIGGFIGSVLRYLASGIVQDLSRSVAFPYGTLAVNIAGCFIIGFLSYVAESRGMFTAESRDFVFVGILGGFTTFSTFGNESVNLWRDGQQSYFFANVAAHLILGFAAVWLGRVAAFKIWG
jgi:fluoride exporter